MCVALLAATASSAASVDPPPSPYEALAFLVGHCWRGTFPGGQMTDEHCFSWVYGGQFVRDQHVLHRPDGAEAGRGESLYVWDSVRNELQYLYIESGGGFSRGTVQREGEALVFPASRYSEKGTEQRIRSRWVRSGEEAYDVATDFRVKGHWQPGFRVHMQLQPGS